jgi:hypothetical protein
MNNSKISGGVIQGNSAVMKEGGAHYSSRPRLNTI